MRLLLLLFLVARVALAHNKPEESPRASEAEELFKKIEQKHLKAKSLKYKVNIKIAEKGGSQEMESEGILQEGNLLKITLEVLAGGKAKPMRIYCDGKKKHIDIGRGQGRARVTDAPKDLEEGLRYIIVRGGAALSMELVQSRFDTSLKDKIAVEDLRLGNDEKVGERNCRVLTYTPVMTGPGGRPTGMLWVDAETYAFVKRELTYDQGGSLIETYVLWKLDEEIKKEEFAPGNESPAGTFQGQPASYWIGQLDQQDVKRRAEAVKALAAIGEKGVPGLLKAFQGGERQIQSLAFESLKRLGSQVGKQAIATYLEAVKDRSNEERRQWAAILLAGMGPEADEAISGVVVPILIDAIKEGQQPSLRMSSISLIASIGPRAKAAVPALLELLREADEALRQNAAYALARNGPDGGGVTALIAVAKDVSHVGRLEAVRALGETKVESKEAVEALVSAMQDHPAFRDEGRLMLRSLGPRARAAIPALLKALHDDSLPGAKDSAFTLGRVAGEEDVPALLAALKDPDARVRGGVAYALGTLAGRPEGRLPAKAAVPALVQALKDNEVAVRENAAFALGMIGPEAREAVPALIEALKDRGRKSQRGINGSVRANATEALSRVDPGAEAVSAIPALLEIISGKAADSPAHRSLAFQAIGGILRAGYDKDGNLLPQLAIDQGAEAAVPALIKIIKKRGTEPSEFEMAFEVLGAIGPRAQAAMPVIKGLIEDKNFTLPNVRSLLVGALWSVSARDKTAVKEIRNLTNDAEECIRRAAIQILELESVQRIEKGDK